MPPVDELQRHLPDRPEASQDSQSILLNNKITRRASLSFINGSRGCQKPTYRASSLFLSDLLDSGRDSVKPKRSVKQLPKLQ
ncbi:hypothetical protein DPMN_063298 [Dreissena polymorpha]|uniref:Uncharacterized protein n=1 Tax=Dreissena polymorpha TaxID=45954 RepID=A0A9D4CB33_DREPO|nr:hypothetical protein DPMN_063298 [Dreissena polymorpha]